MGFSGDSPIKPPSMNGSDFGFRRHQLVEARVASGDWDRLERATAWLRERGASEVVPALRRRDNEPLSLLHSSGRFLPSSGVELEDLVVAVNRALMRKGLRYRLGRDRDSGRIVFFTLRLWKIA